jgi:hypothetical protein
LVKKSDADVKFVYQTVHSNLKNTVWHTNFEGLRTAKPETGPDIGPRQPQPSSHAGQMLRHPFRVEFQMRIRIFG